MKDLFEKRDGHSAALSWLYKTTGRSRLLIALITLLRSLTSGCSVISALVFKSVIDSVTGGDGRGFFSAAILYALIFIGQNLLYSLIFYLEEVANFRLESRFRARLYRALFRANYREMEKWHTGELTNRLNGDVDIVVHNMITLIPAMAAMLVRLSGSALVLSMLSIEFCLVFIIGGILVAIGSAFLRRIMKRLQKAVRSKYDDIHSFQQETLDNAVMLRSFQAEDRAELMLADHMAELKQARLRKNAFSNLINTGLSFAMDAGYFFGLIWCGIAILRGEMSFGTMSAVLSLVGQVQQPFANISSLIPRYYNMLVSAERLMEIEELPKEEHPEHKLPDPQALYRGMDFIQINDMSFSYGRVRVFEEASLRIDKQDIMALVGPSGIGKSTLIKLLLALYEPTKGEIVLHDESGELHALSPDTRGLFAYVPQRHGLISGSICEAVAFLQYGEKLNEEQKERVKKACRMACADSFIEALPMQYDTQLGEHGAGLSEGQMQRISIARAVYTGAPILILDEATSALDEDTEEQVLKNIQSLSDKTVLIVTHRKKALDICNRIIRIKGKDFEEVR